jgi:hypothetical protein
MRLRYDSRAALVLLAAAAALVPVPRPVVESMYSNRVFPILQFLLTGASNLFPFALFDLLVIGVAIGGVVIVFRDIRVVRHRAAPAMPAMATWLAVARRILLRLAVLTSAAYLLFLLAWGLNYRRVPLQDKLQFDANRVSGDAAVELARQSVERVNALHVTAHRDGWAGAAVIDPVLADAFDRARRQLALPSTRPGRPKRTLLDPYFRRVGVAGMTDPFFLETLVATDLLPFERPAVIAHEWGHLAGVADEGDANFLAWLTCLRGDPAHQYSGWLSLFGDVANALQPSALREVGASLADGPRADLQAVRDRLLRHVNPTLSAAGWKAYDRYLKANQVDEGAASYAAVVRLILGTEFGPDWTPLRRGS